MPPNPRQFLPLKPVELQLLLSLAEGERHGYALVQEIAQLHGGRVMVESELGQGSTFRVRIPLGRAHLPAERVVDADCGSSTALGSTPYVQ